MIPTHLTDGRLPEGVHAASWIEVAETLSFSSRRRAMLVALYVALGHLKQAGCKRVWLGGSFVRTKANPMDIDVVWDIDGVDPDLLHPAFLTPDAREWTKAVFASEFFPSHIVEGASNLPMVEFFQRMRDGRPCGVVEVDLDTL